jgi:hypothetical protein
MNGELYRNELIVLSFPRSIYTPKALQERLNLLNAVLKRTGKSEISSVSIVENKAFAAEIIGGKACAPRSAKAPAQCHQLKDSYCSFIVC